MPPSRCSFFESAADVSAFLFCAAADAFAREDG